MVGRSSGMVKQDKSNIKKQNHNRTSESHNMFQSNLTKFSKNKIVKNINDKLDKECIYAVVNKPQKNIKE